MLSTNDFLTEAHEHAVRSKTERVKADGAEAGWAFMVVANRGSEHVATFFPTNRDPMLWTIRLAVGAFGCDLVAGNTDCYQVKVDPDKPDVASVNPDTGQKWAQGDMQRAFAKGRPWVGESLTTYAIDKASQQLLMTMQSYRAKNHKIRWDERVTPDIEMRGLVPDALHEAMATPDLMAHMNRVAGAATFGLDPTTKRALMDAYAIRLCSARSIPVAYNVSDPDVRRIVELELGDEERNAQFGVPDLRMRPLLPDL